MAVKIGTRFHAIHADSNAEWAVTEKRGRGTWIAQITPENLDWTGVERAFTTEAIEQSIHADAAWARGMDEHDAFYAGLKVGQIVHYDNGHNTFVRCEVVLGQGRADEEPTVHGKALKAIALVGNWRDYDLPKRQADGEIYYGYHAQQIIDGKLMEPNYSNIYEARDNEARAQFYSRPQLDPRDLPAVDLSVPDLTEAQKQDADLVRLVQEIAALTRHDDDRRVQLTPRQKLAAIHKLTNSERALRHMA